MYSRIAASITDNTKLCVQIQSQMLTGFFSVVADDSGVNDGIQKLGRSLSRPPTMFETLDAAAAPF